MKVQLYQIIICIILFFATAITLSALLGIQGREIDEMQIKYAAMEQRAFKAEVAIDSLTRELDKRVTVEYMRNEIIETIKFCRSYYKNNPQALEPDYD